MIGRKLKHSDIFTSKEIFPNIDKEINDYNKILILCENMIKKRTKGQNYTREFPLPSGGFYNMGWDIEKAKKIIKKRKLPVQEIRISLLWQNVSKENLDLKYINNNLTYNDYEPLIVVNYTPLNVLIVIDGNHRIAKQAFRNVNGFIKVYILDNEHHLPAMLGEYFRVRYKIMHNFRLLENSYANNAIEHLEAPKIYKFNILKYKIFSSLKWPF